MEFPESPTRFSKSFPRGSREKGDVPAFAPKKTVRQKFALPVFHVRKTRRSRSARRQLEHVADDAVVGLRVNPQTP